MADTEVPTCRFSFAVESVCVEKLFVYSYNRHVTVSRLQRVAKNGKTSTKLKIGDSQGHFVKIFQVFRIYQKRILNCKLFSKQGQY